MVSGVRQSTGLQPADIEFGHPIEVISAEESLLSPCLCLHLDRKPLKGGHQVVPQGQRVELPFLAVDCLLGRCFSSFQLTISFRDPAPTEYALCTLDCNST